MIAEELGLSGNAANISAGRRLVTMALGVDPIFSADLARLCGAGVCKGLGQQSRRLRNIYINGNEHNREWALAGMIASGSEDFKDILLPLWSNDNHQVRLKTYRAGRELRVSSLRYKLADYRQWMGRTSTS